MKLLLVAGVARRAWERDRVCVFAAKLSDRVGITLMRISRALRLLFSLGVAAALSVLGGAGRAEAQGFSAPVPFHTGSQPGFVATADVNGDGHPDLIYVDAGATASASTTHVLLGDGRGGFTQSAVLQTAGTALVIGNLTGAGLIDIGWVYPVRTQNGGLTLGWTIAPGIGDGSFGTAIAKTLSGPLFSSDDAIQLTSMMGSNLDNRRLTSPEIVGVDKGSASLFQILLDPDLVDGTTEPLAGKGPLVVADLNTDGIDDYIVNSPVDSRVRIFLGASSFTGGPLITISSSPVFEEASGVSSLLIKDFNGDGKPDLAAEGASGRIDVFAGNGDGTFQTSAMGGTKSASDSSGDGGHLIAAADLNGDGILDLLTYTTLGLSVELGSAGGSYSLQGVYPVGAGAGTNAQFVTADFNGDGLLDVAIDAPGGIEILYGKAAGDAAGCTAPQGMVIACPEPSAFEGAFTLSASVPAGSEGGTVTFSIAGSQGYETQAASLGSAPVVNGVATLMVPGKPLAGAAPIIPGTYTVAGSYLAANSTLAENLPGTHTISLAPTTVTLTPAPPTTTFGPTYFYGQGVNGYVHFNVLDPTYPATGSWTQLSNGLAVTGCVDLPANSQAVCPYGYPTLLDAGNYVFTEAYNGGPANGDPVNASSVSTGYAFTVLPDTTTASALISSMNPAPAGTPVTFTATLTGNAAVPTGTVRFLDGANVVGSGMLNAAGQASLTTSTLGIGIHPITAVYAATQDFNGATSAVLNQVITPVPLASAVTLTSSVNPSLVGQAVTFTAVASVPGPFPFQIRSGTMTFLDGTTVIGTGAIDQFGRAIFTTSSLATGSHPITAAYPGGKIGGGEAIAPGVSAVLTQIVDTTLQSAPTGFTLTVTPTLVTVRPGNTAVLQVTVGALSGFSEPVSLACAGINDSNELGCAFFESTIPAGGGSTTLQVSATAPYPCGGSRSQPYGSQQSEASAPACGSTLRTGQNGRISSPHLLEAGAMMMTGVLWLWPGRRRRQQLLAALLMAGAIGLSGCGTCTNLGTRPGSYSVTVTGTAGSLVHTVVLQVKVLDP